ncbi:carbon-nitrogen hydrolase family protein [Tundrisphaera sp. TA3]|uniref:carbon-nitrogen hydrolase family protein n=1 Tax=Tundrisphaera sp. TA3 TaxID=3435775 RepID=UPI003EBDFEF7
MSESPTYRVAVAQIDPKIGEVAANLVLILDGVDEAAAGGAHLVIFPECALSGYGFTSKEEALPFAESIPGPATDAVAKACARLGLFAIFGLLERDGDRLFNACVLIGPDGLVGSYRKIHLPFMGVDRFATPGDRPFEVLDAGGLRVGMHICYDGGFPEPGRVLTLLGADLLVLPTNWPVRTEAIAEHLMICRAMENVIFALAANRVGEERGFPFLGRSSIAGPNGELLARADDQPGIIYADIDPARARQKRQVRVPGQHEIDRIADRRPEFYASLIEPKGRV